MLKINTVTMEEKIFEILFKTILTNTEIEQCTKELLNLFSVNKRDNMEIYEVKIEEYHENEYSLGLFKNLKDAIKVAEEYRIKTVDNDKWVESYNEVFNDWHLMEWVAVGKYANHGVTIDKRNVL